MQNPNTPSDPEAQTREYLRGYRIYRIRLKIALIAAMEACQIEDAENSKEKRADLEKAEREYLNAYDINNTSPTPGLSDIAGRDDLTLQQAASIIWTRYILPGA